jgi:NAD(P)-dependent dehydrogenase (short-subunit alcohol dehydrogenase family)
MDLGLSGKRAIVTGGTRGIGAAIVDLLIAEGAHVATCARNPDEVAALQQSANQTDQKLTVSVCDVGNKAAYESWLASSVSALGGVDIFVANVSGMGGEGEEGWKRTFDVDLMATVRGCESLLGPMAQGGGGSMVIISSISGLEAVGGAGAYGTIKAGLIAYSSQMAEMAGAHGIRVNAVSPGPIHVDGGFWGNVKAGDPQMYDAVSARHPSGRMGTTREVANCVAFLASDAASWVTGTNLIVDGGMTKRVQF